MAAKKKRLIDELAGIEAQVHRTGSKPFYVRLQAENASLYAELCEVIASHSAGGLVAQKLPTMRHLKRELDSRNLLPKCSESAFREWYRFVTEKSKNAKA